MVCSGGADGMKSLLFQTERTTVIFKKAEKDV